MYISRKYSFAHGLLGLRFFVKSINGKPPLVFCWHLTSYCDVTDRSSSTNPPNPWAILFVWLWLHSFTRESRFMSYLQIYRYSFQRNDLSLVNCINALVKFWIKRKRLIILWFYSECHFWFSSAMHGSLEITLFLLRHDQFKNWAR